MISRVAFSSMTMIRLPTLLFLTLVVFFAKGQSVPVNGCSRTSFRKSFILQGDTVIGISQSNTPDGGKLISGRHKPTAVNRELGFVIKLDAIASVEWSAGYSFPNPDIQIRIVQSIPASGSSYLLGGRITSISDPAFNKTLVIKVNAAGTIIWSRIISIDPAVDTNARIQLESLLETSDGNILLVGTVPDDTNSATLGQYGFLVKMNAAGDILFSQLFVSGSSTRNDPIAVFEEGPAIRVFGMIEDGTCPGLDVRAMYSMKLNPADGSMISSHRYCFSTVPGIISFAEFHHNYEVTRTTGGYALYGFLGEGGPGKREFLASYFSSDGAFLKAYSIKDPLTGSSYHNIAVDNNGNFALFGQKSGQSIYQACYNAAGELLHQRQIDQSDFNSLHFLNENGQKISFNADGSYDYISNHTETGGPAIEFLHSNVTDKYSDGCLGNDTIFSSSASDFRVDNAALQFAQILSNSIQSTSFAVTEELLTISTIKQCEQTTHCDQIRIEGRDTLCPGDSSAIFSVHRSIGCTQPVRWRMDSTMVTRWSLMNDSAVSISLRTDNSVSHSFKVYVSLADCPDNKDSITVLLPAMNVSKFTTQAICAGDSLILHAPTGYISYQWQDASGDSMFVSHSPGLYSVILTNESGCRQTDSFQVMAAADYPAVSLGPEQELCRGQSLTLHAGPKFSQYQWQDGSTDSTYTVNRPGVYRVEVRDPCGQASSDIVQISAGEFCDGQFLMPNAFTPDGDGKNDRISPIIHQKTENYSFSIYNRWGQWVFKSQIPGIGWDGNLNGIKQPSDSYVWICHYQMGGKSYSTNGNLILIR